jgi:probable selenium-dependent hydroxylase accessory protein YqeC
MLTDALDAAGAELVAFVGAGGKTTALQRLAVEKAIAGSRVIATTTTAMFAQQLACLGPLSLTGDAGGLLANASVSHEAGIVALARSLGADGKVRGLWPSEIDALWQTGFDGSVLVEADGSRCLPLKAFGMAEPQLPSATTTAVVVAGLDSLDQPLDEGHVHRAESLTSVLHIAKGARATTRILAAAVGLQVARVKNLAPEARVIVLLNKADRQDRLDRGVEVAALVGTGSVDLGEPSAALAPDRIVVANLWSGRYRVLPE